MTVIAPPELPQRHGELEALIEEARRRARRRRLKYAAAGAAALLLAGGVYAGLELTGTFSATGPRVPEGFQLVQAKGPVSHAVLRLFPSRVKSIDLTTAEEHPVVTTQEIWWDPKAGLVRDVDRVGGWITSDYVRNPCWISHGAPGRSQNFCIPPPPYFLKKSGFRWPLDSGAVVQTGRGTYHGHGVIWVVGLVNGRRPRDDFQRVGLDVRTHQPVVMQEVGRGRVINGYEVSSMDELPAKDVAFTVPKGGAPRNTPSESRSDEARGLDAARGALGTTPLWLGRSFRGSRLHRVAVGTEGALTEAGRLVEPARFVRFGYGSFTIEEYGSHRPFWLLEGPEPGVVLLNAGGPMSLSRDGLLVVASPRGASFRMDKATALALAKALRPLPAR